MGIPDPIERMNGNIERMIDKYEENKCMSCSKKVDYDLIPASSSPDSIGICFECLSPEDQKLFNKFEDSL